MKQLLLLYIAMFIATVMYSQPGTIDKTYGTDKTGIVAISARAFIQTSVMQPDNKLIAGGLGYATKEYKIFRHNTDGSPDTSFGNKGAVITTFDDLIDSLQQIIGWQSIAVQPDGKIVAGGTAVKFKPGTPGDYPSENDIVLARFLPDGTPDKSFGRGGKLVTDLGKQETASAIAIQEDGRIVVAGYQEENSNGDYSHILVLRYNTDGSLDESFGQGKGYVLYTKAITSNAYALLLQPDNKIVVGGSADVDRYFFLVRYLPDGSVDAAFGNGGEVRTSFGTTSNNQIRSLALDEKGNIAAAGVFSSEEKAIAIRYLPDGTIDNSFGAKGKVEPLTNEAPYSYANTILAQPDGKLIIMGVIAGDKYTYWTPFLQGLNADGSPDAAFGTDGQTIANISLGQEFYDMAVMQKDGKIVISGNKPYSANPDDAGYVLARFIGYPTQVPLFVRIKRWLKNHNISWKSLPAADKIAYYSIERSDNGKTGFTQIAKVSGVSNLKNYSISNSNLLQGENYYRVKAVSTDGVIRYSETASADNTAAASASVYPNPAKDFVTVNGLQPNEPASISISNGSGAVLAKGTNNGGTQYRASTSGIKPGTYYINITTKGKTEALTFVKE